MSLHLNRQCQRADASLPPVRLVPGVGMPTKRDTNTVAVREGRRRCCEGAYMEGASGPSTAFFEKIAERQAVIFWKRLGNPGFPMSVRPTGYRSAAPRPRPRSARFCTSPGRRSRRFPESRPSSTTGKWRIRRWVIVASAARIGVRAVDRLDRRAHHPVDRPVEHLRRHGRRRSGPGRVRRRCRRSRRRRSPARRRSAFRPASDTASRTACPPARSRLRCPCRKDCRDGHAPPSVRRSACAR